MAIIKRRRPYPKRNAYQDYKPELRQGFQYKCAYCSIHENEWGGPRHFHVEHFKPKSNPKFKHLELQYGNLMYACDVCNTFKGNDWPGYLDPCKVDYDVHFVLDCITWEVHGRSRSAKYMVERLHLNRRHLLRMRQWRAEAENVHRLAETLCSDAIAKIDKELAKNPSPSTVDALNTARGVIEAMYQFHGDSWNQRWDPKIEDDDMR